MDLNRSVLISILSVCNLYTRKNVTTAAEEIIISVQFFSADVRFLDISP
jgi:hypothetical protein